MAQNNNDSFSSISVMTKQVRNLMGTDAQIPGTINANLLNRTTTSAAEDMTVSLTGATDSSLILSSTGTGVDALQITASAGGIDISSKGDADDDIDITATGTSVNISSDEPVGDAIVLDASGAGGGVITRTSGPSVGTGFDGATLARWFPSGTSSVSGGTASVVEWKFIVDLTDLLGGNEDLDIIGEEDAMNCNFGQYTTAQFGTLVGASITCLETPTGGPDDIDIYSADEATGTEDTLITGLTNYTALHRHAAAWAAGEVAVFTSLPAANQYLYFTTGEDGGNGIYTAGQFLITFYGTSTI